MNHLLTQVVTVRQYAEGVEDEGGTPGIDFVNPVEYQAWLEHTDSTEVTFGRNVATSDWLLILPKEADIDAKDRVEADGRTFEVVSVPDLVRTPLGPHHYEARLTHIG